MHKLKSLVAEFGIAKFHYGGFPVFARSFGKPGKGELVWQEGTAETPAEIKQQIDEFNGDLRSDENIYGSASIQQSIEEDRR